MVKKPAEPGRFQTHIKEPRWQSAASVLIVLVVLALWLVFAVF